MNLEMNEWGWITIDLLASVGAKTVPAETGVGRSAAVGSMEGLKVDTNYQP